MNSSGDVRKGIIRGLLTGGITFVALLLILAAIYANADLSKGLLVAGTVMTQILPTFIGGYFSAHVCGRAGWKLGLAIAAGLNVMVLVAGLCISGLSLSLWFWLRFVLSLFAGTLGGVMGVNRKSHHDQKAFR